MPKSPEYGTPDKDSPEWTAERMKRAMRFADLPAAVQVAAGRPGKRGPQKKPTKILSSIRLSADVLSAMRLTGRGWQGRADATLRREFIPNMEKKA